MFRDKVTCARMEASSQKTTYKQVPERICTSKSHKEVVKYALYENIQDVNTADWNLVNDHWTECIEEYLEGCKESFA